MSGNKSDTEHEHRLPNDSSPTSSLQQVKPMLLLPMKSIQGQTATLSQILTKINSSPDAPPKSSGCSDRILEAITKQSQDQGKLIEMLASKENFKDASLDESFGKILLKSVRLLDGAFKVPRALTEAPSIEDKVVRIAGLKRNVGPWV